MTGEILSILLFSLSIFFGFSFIRFFDPKSRFFLFERIAFGGFLGILFLGYSVLFLSLIFRSETKTIFFIFAFLIIYFILFFVILQIKKIKKISFSSDFLREKIGDIKKIIEKKQITTFLFFLFLLVLFSFLYLNKNLFKKYLGGSCVSFYHSYFDTALHLTLFRVFSEREPFSLEHPLFKGKNLTYTFFADYFSSIPRRLGAPEEFSFYFPQVLTILFVSLMLIAFLKRFFPLKWAIVCYFFIFLGSGLAFLNWPQTFNVVFLQQGGASYQEFSCYEMFGECHQEEIPGLLIKNGIPWRTTFFNFFVWQRPFIYGLGLFLMVLFGIFLYSKQISFLRYSIFIPLFYFSHLHSLISLFFFMAVFFFLQEKKKIWFFFFLFALIFSWPFFIFFADAGGGKVSLMRNFFYFKTGWLAKSYGDPIWLFYLKNFGFLLIFYFFSLKYLDRFSPFLRRAFLASVSLLIMPNLFLFAPRDFDNNKILFYFWFFASIFSTFFLRELLEDKKRDLVLGNFFVIGVVVLVVLIVLPGFSDLILGYFHVKNNYFCYRDTNPLLREIGDFIKENLPKNAYILSTGNIDDIVAFYAGRNLYVGFSNYLWSHGLAGWDQREREIKEILRKGDVEALREKGIYYMLLDKGLGDYWRVGVFRSKFFEKAKVLFSQEKEKRYLLYFPPEN